MAPKITQAWLEANLWAKIPAVVSTQVPILQSVRSYLREVEAEKLKSVCIIFIPRY
jgi:hypothetical protein